MQFPQSPYTRILTADGRSVYVPNGAFVANDGFTLYDAEQVAAATDEQRKEMRNELREYNAR